MRLALVGVGTAGGRIVNQIVDRQRASGRNLSNGNSLVITSEPPTFDAPERIPEARRLIVGDVHPEVDGRGTDGDPDLAAEVARADQNEILRAFDVLEFYGVDGVLVAAGLGGGTGGGAGAVVIEELQGICDKPVYALGVLPSESEGRRAALNAARSLQSFVDKADNVVVFDNDAWQGEPEADAAGDLDSAEEPDADLDPVEASDPDDYARVNAALATRVVTLFAAGEFEGPTVAENRMDPSDIIRTFETGGISTIGYAARDVERRPGRIRSWLSGLFGASENGSEEPDQTEATKINQLVRRAARSKLTLPCDVESADRALIMLSGPAESLSRRGFESGRYWLEQETDTVEVMAGDEPHAGASELTAVILFSNVTTVPRIESLKAQAVEA